MHTRLTPVSSSAASTDSACPARPDLTAPHAPTAPSPAATFFTSPAVDPNENHVLPTQRTFGGALEAAGIPHERHEDAGGHIVRPERLQQDIDGVIAHLTKAG